MNKWFAVNTKPYAEFKVITHLSRQNFKTFMPKFLVTRRHARKIEKVLRPFFPSYLFVTLDVSKDSFRAINNTRGVNCILSAGDIPSPIPESIINDLINLNDENGLITKLGKIEYNVGQEVKLNDGPFFGHIGKFMGMKDDQRVSVLLNFLGRQISIPMPSIYISSA